VGGGAVNEDRELLMLLGGVGIRVGEIVTGLFEDSLSEDEQRVFERQLRELAEGFRRRVGRRPAMVEGEVS
jgi:hypothetical protein